MQLLWLVSNYCYSSSWHGSRSSAAQAGSVTWLALFQLRIQHRRLLLDRLAAQEVDWSGLNMEVYADSQCQVALLNHNQQQQQLLPQQEEIIVNSLALIPLLRRLEAILIITWRRFWVFLMLQHRLVRCVIYRQQVQVLGVRLFVRPIPYHRLVLSKCLLYPTGRPV